MTVFHSELKLEEDIDLDKLYLKESEITMATQQVVRVKGSELGADVVSHLVSVQGTYLSAVGGLAQQLPKSR